jgi:NAD(P)-dependent dehydrogenase (short-subunit alcohol dehydrogenase family)
VTRRVVVTGGTRGIGAAIAAHFTAAGDDVVAVGRAECDVTDEAAVTALFERVGPIDVLVNNAGIGSSADPRPLAEFRDAFWDETLEVNLTAPYLLSKAALPHMRAQRWGRIVTVASINGRIPSPHSGAYVASKHGVIGLMRTLALEVAAEGVTVNCVNPGPVRTRTNDARIAYDVQRLGRALDEYERGLTPIGGRLEPEDIAPMVAYLVGDGARMITGQAYNVDGGVNMA